MKPDDFAFLSTMLKERSGLVLSQDKAYLLESRLMPVARARDLKTLDDLVAQLRKKDEALARDVTEAMTTNESFFFRDNTPFDQFKALVLPEMLKNRAAQKSVKIWSAACSSGQEPYSLAMILKEEAAKVAGWRFDILGTDLSDAILRKAKAGLYSQFEVQRGLPIQMLMKYFDKKDESWQIKPEIRSMVRYQPFNLLGSLATLGKFDIIFCRNVLIYFDQDTKKRVLENMVKLMPPDGYLYLGGAETVIGITDAFKPLAGYRGLYTPVQK